MEHWHLEDRRGDILCGARHGIIQPSAFGIICHENSGGPLCPSCLSEIGDEVDDLRRRAQEREWAAQEAAAGMEEGELCLDCDGTGQDLYYRGPADNQPCETCRGRGRVGL